LALEPPPIGCGRCFCFAREVVHPIPRDDALLLPLNFPLRQKVTDCRAPTQHEQDDHADDPRR
jgi:hypothetical protein